MILQSLLNNGNSILRSYFHLFCLHADDKFGCFSENPLPPHPPKPIFPFKTYSMRRAKPIQKINTHGLGCKRRLPLRELEFGAPISKHEIIANWGFMLQNFIYLKFGQIRAADFHPKINMAYFLRATNWNLGGTRWNFF